jgi:hypothetical protein
VSETIVEILARLRVPQEHFCELAGISLDDLHAIDEGAAIAPARVAAILKLLRYCGKQKLGAVMALLEAREAIEREWRTIDDFPSYEVSSDGLVRRRTSSLKGALRTLRQHISSDGYLRVTLYRTGKPEPQRVHRLVCRAFHGHAPEGKPFACHRNGDKTDSHERNLYWGSSVENAADWQQERRERIANAVHRKYTPAWRRQQRHLKRLHESEK